MEKINAELGKVVCDELAFNDAVDTLINDITRQSANAIKILRERFTDEITDDVKSLERFSDVAKFEDFINDARTSYVNNVTFMPFEERDRINRMYDDLRNACVDAVKILAKLFQLPYDLKYDGIKLVPDKSVIEKEIRKNFIVPLTDEQREYYVKLASVHNSIADLNQFEQEHKLNEFSVHGYSDIRFGLYKNIKPYNFLLNFNEANYIDGLKTGMFFNED
jgi:transcriptional regulator NrdR family protein